MGRVTEQLRWSLVWPPLFGLWIGMGCLGCDEAPTEAMPAPIPDMQPMPDSAVVDAVPPPDLPPTWSAMAELTLEPSEDRLRLQWSGAGDDDAVTGYRVERDGVLIAELHGGETSLLVPMPLDLGRYTFRVAAGDTAHQWTMGPTAEYIVDDGTAPTWADGASLAVSSLSLDGLTLAWPHAMDDVAVTGYLLAEGDADPMAVEGNQYRVDAVEPGEERRFQVWAEDAAGHRSEPLGVTVTIPWGAGPVWPNESVIEAVGTRADAADLRWTGSRRLLRRRGCRQDFDLRPGTLQLEEARVEL